MTEYYTDQKYKRISSEITPLNGRILDHWEQPLNRTDQGTSGCSPARSSALLREKGSQTSPQLTVILLPPCLGSWTQA